MLELEVTSQSQWYDNVYAQPDHFGDVYEDKLTDASYYIAFKNPVKGWKLSTSVRLNGLYRKT